ncbi:MAG: electron transport complex subunit RsxG [Gammaproteobacteria bacterium]
MSASRRQTLLAGATVGICAVLLALANGLSQRMSEPLVTANERDAAMRVIRQILPSDVYDNSPANDVIVVRDKDLLGGDQPRRVFRAYQASAPVAVLIETVAPNGYSGPIRLLVGVYRDGRIAAVRVTAHRETAGLGDRIERARSDWIDVFSTRSLTTTAESGWAVRADGGDFDQFTGATVTPRAVVQAVRNALLYFEQHQDELFAPAP